MYIYIYIYIYIQIYIFIYITGFLDKGLSHPAIRIFDFSHQCAPFPCVPTPPLTHTRMITYAWSANRMHVNTSICTHTHMHARADTRANTYTRARVCAYVFA